MRWLKPFKEQFQLVRKATLNVIKEDQHQFQYILKNKLGYEIFNTNKLWIIAPILLNFMPIKILKKLKIRAFRFRWIM